MTPQIAEVRAAWDEIASGYDRFVTGSGRPIADDALQRAGLSAGMTVLDVASGSGAVSIPAARLGADVTAIDLSPRMIERLRARADQEGVSDISAHVMDAHTLDFPDGTFDIAASQFGVMLVPDLPRALGEMVRVTRPGGRVLVISYAEPPKIGFLTLFLGAIKSTVPAFPGLPSDPPPLEFQVSNPERLRQRMAEAGLRDVRVEAGAEELEFRTGQDAWDWVTNSNPIGRMLVGGLTDEQRAGVLQALDDAVESRANDAGTAVVTNPVNIGIGTK